MPRLALTAKNQPSGPALRSRGAGPFTFNPTHSPMFIFKILKTIVALLPWLLLAVVIYALWPLIHFVFGLGHGVHNLFR